MSRARDTYHHRDDQYSSAAPPTGWNQSPINKKTYRYYWLEIERKKLFMILFIYMLLIFFYSFPQLLAKLVVETVCHPFAKYFPSRLTQTAFCASRFPLIRVSQPTFSIPHTTAILSNFNISCSRYPHEESKPQSDFTQYVSQVQRAYLFHDTFFFQRVMTARLRELKNSSDRCWSCCLKD